MSDFSDRPFVAGSLIGLRAFGVDELGRLVGPAYGGVFKPSENEAKCGGDSPHGQLTASFGRAMRAASWRFTVPPMTEIEGPVSSEALATVSADPPKRPPHVVAGVDCGCGYYAYFNGDNTYAEPERVSALVEGYGVCTVGEKGFRASKARLVALVLSDPKPRDHDRHARWDRLADWSYRHGGANSALVPLGGMAGFWSLTGGVVSATNGHWWAGVPLVLLGLVLVFAAFRILPRAWTHGLHRNYKNIHPELTCVGRPSRVAAELIRRNYPDVPTYPSVEAALVEHPLTPPPPPRLPTPDEDDDFWTRPAS